MKYNPNKIERKWQKFWETKKLYNTKDYVAGKENKMLLTEFAYPSGNLHLGHWYAFALPDIQARYLRMKGFNVLYPTGFDAFGLPAENAAIKNNIHPEIWTKKNIAYMTKQLKSMGATFDWSREVSTIDPDYYKWTQWMFLKFYEKGLAYRASTKVNWCPKDKTVLANEQVVTRSTESGQVAVCDRCGSEVIQKELAQWMFKITDFADELIDDLKDLDWQETAKLGQINWIGRSEGAIIKFKLDALTNADITQKNAEFSQRKSALSQRDSATSTYVEVFTTRPDTIFGATFLVISPEMAQKWIDTHGNVTPPSVRKYVQDSLKKTELERQENRQKTGADTGAKALNPLTGQEIPIWVADYVLGGYGTGAIMAVPAHDQRDFEFAKKFGLPIKSVINSSSEASAKFINRSLVSDWRDRVSDKYKYVSTPEFVEFSIPGPEIDSFISFGQTLLKDGPYYFSLRGGTKLIVYKDRVFDIFQADQDAEAKVYGREHKIPEPELEWSTVYIEDGQLINSGKFNGLKSGEARDKIVKELKTKGSGDFQKTYRLHDWILSRQRYWGVPIPMINCQTCGYQPVSEKELPIKLPPLKDFKPADDGRSPLAKATKWLKVKCPKCKGDAERETDTMDTFVDSSWYFIRYTDPKNKKEFASKKKMSSWLPVPMYLGGAEHTTMHLLYSRFFAKALNSLGYVDFNEPFLGRRNRGIILGPDNQKMSKSRGNVIDPDIEVKKYGADAVRMYLAFMGPYEQGGAWSPQGLNGVYRFLNRVWNFVGKLEEPKTPDKEIEKILNKATKEIGEDIRDMKFNTGVSGLMKLINALDDKQLTTKQYETFLKLLAPFAPHLAEELWMNVLKKNQPGAGPPTAGKSIHLEKWPEYNEELLKDEVVDIIVQVNGKIRDLISVKSGASENEVAEAAKANGKIKIYIGGVTIKKVIFVKDRIINFVV